MTIDEMRDRITNAYPGRSWKARCSVMSDSQVIAIFYSILNREGQKEKKVLRSGKPGYQLTIFDLLKEEE